MRCLHLRKVRDWRRCILLQCRTSARPWVWQKLYPSVAKQKAIKKRARSWAMRLEVSDVKPECHSRYITWDYREFGHTMPIMEDQTDAIRKNCKNAFVMGASEQNHATFGLGWLKVRHFTCASGRRLQNVLSALASWVSSGQKDDELEIWREASDDFSWPRGHGGCHPLWALALAAKKRGLSAGCLALSEEWAVVCRQCAKRRFKKGDVIYACASKLLLKQCDEADVPVHYSVDAVRAS